MAVLDGEAAFPEGHYLAIYNGVQPSLGYAMTDITAQNNAITLILDIGWVTPTQPPFPGSTQITSTPCAVVALENFEGIQNIQVNLNGEMHAEIPAP